MYILNWSQCNQNIYVLLKIANTHTHTDDSTRQEKEMTHENDHESMNSLTAPIEFTS